MRRLLATAALIAVAGCQAQTYVDKQKVDQQPMTVDLAMQQRQWDPTTAYYENGQVHTWSTGFAYTAKHDFPPYTYAATDTGTFVLNFVTLPVTYYNQWGGVTSGGVQLPPSYTAVPPMPPSTQPAE